MIFYYNFLILLAIFPSFLILSYVYKKDREKEPKKLLIALFGVGIVSVFLTLILSSIFEMIFPFMSLDASKQSNNDIFVLILYSFIQVAFIEEFCKWIFDYFIIWNNVEFDHKYDSIVYAVFVSLGFATFENILYVVMNKSIGVAILRALISVPAHAFFAVSMGYYMGLAKMHSISNNKGQMKKYKFYSIAIPTFLHGLFDFGLMSGKPILIYLSFGLVIYLYISGIGRIKTISNEINNLNILKNN